MRSRLVKVAGSATDGIQQMVEAPGEGCVEIQMRRDSARARNLLIDSAGKFFQFTGRRSELVGYAVLCLPLFGCQALYSQTGFYCLQVAQIEGFQFAAGPGHA